jgi:Holliday junction resolvase-like predicted endonuclease
MSSVSKGKAFEKFCADQLEQAGWTILFRSIRVRFGAIDFAGMWDIVAVKRTGSLVQWLFVQCKSRKLYGKERQALVDWMRLYGFAGINCVVAIKTKIKNRVGIHWDYL